MKKVIATLFLFIYLFSSTEFSQLLKIPVLIEHFKEHRKGNSHLTFGQFLYLHYALADDHDADQERDMQLPFKSHENPVTFVLNAHLPSQKLVLSKPVTLLEKKVKHNEQQPISSAYFSNIWQPPRSC